MKRYLLPLALLSCIACSNNGPARIELDEGTLLIEPMAEDAFRVRLTPGDAPQLGELIFTENVKPPKSKVKDDGRRIIISTSAMSAEFDKENGSITFKDRNGNVFLQEKAGGRVVSKTDADGFQAYSVSQTFISPADEHLYGTGQFQDGYLDIRGLSRRLTQVNTQISIPMVLSSKGYGLLWHNYGLTELNPADDVAGEEIEVAEDGDYGFLLDVGRSMTGKQYVAIDGEVLLDHSNVWLPPTVAAKSHLSKGRHSIEIRCAKEDSPTLHWRRITDETTFRSPVGEGLDYTVFAGNADAVMKSYRSLSGRVPRMPDWVFRYIHCREKYSTQDELVAAAKRFHDEGIPVGTIVQDWLWWGKYGWNAMQFDEDRYPDPAGMVKEVHDLGQHVMLSVWSKITHDCEVGRQMADNGFYVEGTDWVDFFKPEAAACYWDNFSKRLLPTGIDAWWQDATEPENDDLAGHKVGHDGLPGEFYRDVYPLKVINTVYEGLRRDDPSRQPVILTRSGFAGMQRYGAMTWSGDVGSSFVSLKRQLAGGLGQMAAGLPWWTYDAGGFFRPGDQYTNADYQETMIRWIQASVFLPFMRVHGYYSRTEPWEYFPETRRRFEACIAQREALLPYILECARKVSEEDYTIMRPLVFDFADDEEALKQDCEYMFGPDYLVCPVTEPGVSSWRVYLPKNEGGWQDIRNGSILEGGRYHDVQVDLEAIPVFKRIVS